MMIDFLEVASQKWSAPFVYSITAIICLLLLYPVVWRILGQVPVLVRALNEVKNLEDTIVRLSDQVEKVKEFQIYAEQIGSKMPLLQEILATVSLNSAQLSSIESEKQEQIQPSDVSGQRQEVNNWQYLSDQWQDVRYKLEKIISEIPDGRVRRKYSSLHRRDYVYIIGLLYEDGLLSKLAAEKFKIMNEIYLRHRNQRQPVTDQILEQFRKLNDDAGLI